MTGGYGNPVETVTSNDVRHAAFNRVALGARGYDITQVDNFLDRVAVTLEAFEVTERDSDKSAPEQDPPGSAVVVTGPGAILRDVDVRPDGERDVFTDPTTVLELAVTTATEYTNRARLAADRVTVEANARADRVVKDAVAQAARVLKDAQTLLRDALKDLDGQRP